MTKPKILVFAGSIREGSVNTRLANSFNNELSSLNCTVTSISLKDYPLPIYDGDMEASEGVPENAVKLARLMHEHDGYLIAAPEYNGSLSPLLKNTIDWMTRVPSGDDDPIIPFKDKVAAISAASPGGMGGIAMLFHLRDILFRLGSLVISEQVAVGAAGSAFNDDDSLTNERAAGLMSATCKSLIEKAGNFSNG